MRIILTSIGNVIAKDLNEEVKVHKPHAKDEDLQKTTLQGKKFNIFNSHNKKAKNPNNTNSTNFNNFNTTMLNSLPNNTDNIPHSQNVSMMSMTSKTKEVDIHLKKINLNKKANEKYNNLDNDNSLEASLLLPTLPEKLLRKLEEKNDFANGVNHDSSFYTSLTRRKSMENLNNKNTIELYKVSDILKEQSIQKMLQDFRKEERVKQKFTVIRETQFRTPYEKQSEEEKIVSVLNDSIIASNNTNIIQYLSEKDHISKELINKIHGTDSQSQTRLNRICQRIFRNNTLDEVRKSIADNKIQARHNKVKIKYRASIQEMKEELSEGKEILEKYANRKELNKQEIFKEEFKSVKKDWEKYKVERLYHHKKQSSMSDFKTGFGKSKLMSSTLFDSFNNLNSISASKITEKPNKASGVNLFQELNMS